MAWELVKEYMKSGRCEPNGLYSSRKEGLRYAPAVLDTALADCGMDAEERGERIDEFVRCGGRAALVAGDVQFYLSKRMFDVFGHRFADPRGTLRVGGKAVWKDPDGGAIHLVVVDEMDSPEMVRCHELGGGGMELEAPWHELRPTA